MILVDTSVWIRHFRLGDAVLAGLLEDGLVLMHPFVIGELSCGNLKNRQTALRWLRALPSAVEAGDGEVAALVEGRKLWGRGIGWVDAHLLASARLSGCRLWSLDACLASAAPHAGVTAFRR